jgi:hypothetical protein
MKNPFSTKEGDRLVQLAKDISEGRVTAVEDDDFDNLIKLAAVIQEETREHIASTEKKLAHVEQLNAATGAHIFDEKLGDCRAELTQIKKNVADAEEDPVRARLELRMRQRMNAWSESAGEGDS